MTKTARVEQALRKSPLTAKQITARFKVPNVRAMIYDLKRKGITVHRHMHGTSTKFAIGSL
jgi:hypothetical protein